MTAPNDGMRMSAHGRSVLEGFERFRPVAYDDKRPLRTLRPGDQVFGTLTIGYGHTQGVTIGQTIDKAAGDALLSSDLAEREAAVIRLTTRKLTQGQFDALVDFTFTAGVEALATSTLLRKVNAGRPDAEIAAQFRRWIHAAGFDGPVAGLVRRRDAEVMLWTGQGGANPLMALIATPAQAADVEIMPHGGVQPDGMVDEHEALSASKTVWASLTHFFGGLGLVLAGAWHWIGSHVLAVVNWLLNNHDTVSAAAQPLRDSGINWLATAAGVAVALLGAWVVLHRRAQIQEAKT